MPNRIPYASAVYKLPNETLAAIFGHIAHEPGKIALEGSNTLNYRSCTGPFALSHVCSQWRDMVISMPDMWSHFSITKPGPQLVNLVLCWLLRSGDKPLSFGLYQGADNDSYMETIAIFLVLLGHSRRWKSIRLHANCRVELLVNKNSIPRPDALESFHVALSAGADIEVCENLSAFLHQSPCLTEVSWDNTCVLLPLSALQWSNVTALNLYDIQTGHLLMEALDQCVRLETLSILGETTQDIDDNWNAPEVRLPHLHTFVVGRFVEFDDVLVSLTLPSLTRLAFIQGLDSTNLQHSWEVVHDLISRSSCTITSLTIGKVKAKYQDIYISNLKAPNFSSLEDLTLHLHRSIAEIHFLPSDGGNQGIVVRQASLKERGQAGPKAYIRVPKALVPNSVPKTSDVGCAIRYAFAFNAEFTTQ